MRNVIAVEVETPLQGEVAALLQLSDAVAARLYPGEFRRSINPENLANDGTHLLVARIAGEAIGLCALFEREAREVELKRMIVNAHVRGRGAGAALLRGVHTKARQLGAHLILLEVGVRNVEAQALYRRAGFIPRDPFPPYEESPISVFMERSV